MRRLIPLLAAAVLGPLVLAGCQSSRTDAARGPVSTPAAFPAAEFTWSVQPGQGAIEGRATLHPGGKDVHTCAGHEVILSPKTPYTTALVARSRSRADAWEPVRWDPEYDRYRRKATCSSTGIFRFDNLPAGEWYVLAPVFWQATVSRRTVYEGAYLHGEVATTAATTATVNLSDSDRF